MTILYEKDLYIYPDGFNKLTLRLVQYGVQEFIDIRKFYLDFEETWLPTPEGLRFPATLTSVSNFFDSLVDLLSNEEAKPMVQRLRKELLKRIDSTSPERV